MAAPMETSGHPGWVRLRCRAEEGGMRCEGDDELVRSSCVVDPSTGISPQFGPGGGGEMNTKGPLLEGPA